MLLEFTDFECCDDFGCDDRFYFRDIPNGLIRDDGLSNGKWIASVYSDDSPGKAVYRVEDEEPELAANGLISLISDLQDDGDEAALKIKITH